MACLAFCLSILLFPSLLQATAESLTWLSSDTPALVKTADLAPNIAPAVRDTDCTSYTYTPKSPNNSSPRTLCTFETVLGTVGNSNELFTGPNDSLPVQGIEGVGNTTFFLPEIEAMQPVGVYSSTALGNYLGFYTSLDRSQLRLNGSSSSKYYTLKNPPSVWLKDDTGNLLLINSAVLAYSGNGDWLVADFPNIGLARVNLQTFAVSPFAPSLEKPCSIAPSFAKLAISDDGRFVAVSPQGACQAPTSPSLELYDTATCNGSLKNGLAVGASCQHKDIWNGQLNGTAVDTGLTGKITRAQRPTNLFFINDQNLSFDVAYDYVANDDFSVGSFLATVGGLPHQLGLLGLGDSYISGQGTFDYREGTDTTNNGCHLSELSYPFQMKASFASFNSVACSGAKLDDLIRGDGAYKGQVGDGIAQKARNTSDILKRFLPGYINQSRFVAKYQPEALLLSIGGNDIGFSSIISRCATPSKTEPICYDNYEDRADLVNLILSRYRRLVSSFKIIKQASPTSRIFVVGYPQIAKPGGNCADNVLLADKEILFSTELISYLNSVIKQAAAEAGVGFVDTEQAFSGHRLCEGPSKDSALNGFTVGGDVGVTLLGHTVKFVGNESYHPTQLGHQLLAKTILRASNNLTAAMPTPRSSLQAPGFSDTLAILQNVPKTGRPLKLVTNNDPASIPTTVTGHKQLIQVNGTSAALEVGEKYYVSLGSSAPLSTATADNAGNLTFDFTLPTNTEAGYQIIHVYGKNVAGDDIDIQQTINVALPVDDQSQNNCLLVPDSGQDIDSDGIDDACDPLITEPPPYSYPVVVRLLTNNLTLGAQ